MATFEDYLNSIGAEQASIGHGNLRPRYDNEAGTLYHTIDGQTYWNQGGGGPNTYAGIPQKQYSFGEQTQAGVGARPGYVDPSGGFLGYGASPDQLTNPALLRGYSGFIAQDPAREAQQISNRQAEQNLFEQRQASRLAQQQALPNINRTFASQLTGIPQNFGGFGGAMPGFGAQQQQAQPGLLGGLHRGKFGGTGLLGGSGQ